MADRAFEKLCASDNDEIYGDDYKVEGQQITDIGNNVIITFRSLDFGSEGTYGITIKGRTPNSSNSIQIRFTDENGDQITQMVEFPQSFEHTERSFQLDAIKGKNDVSFVFMPGSRFDFDWFRFEK
jgi:Carbohydrate binding module (family 6).